MNPLPLCTARRDPSGNGSAEKPHSTKPSSSRFPRAIRRPQIRISTATRRNAQRRTSEVIDMAASTTDHSILKKIEGLVHEEQHLYGKGELADHDQVRLE